jgi:serine/threonine protein kinase
MCGEKENEGFQIDQPINGKYVIQRFLAEGGMGLVYLAHDSNDIRRKVIIKTLKFDPDSIAYKHKLRHFRQEAEALGRINHEGVVKIFEIDKEEQSGLLFLAMEYAEGPTLTEIIKRGPLEVKKCANYVQQVAFALNAAHKAHVYHRDLKPDNIIVLERQDEPDQIKLIDFGVAKVKESNVAGSTMFQILAGTLEYASPEQLNGKQSIEGEVFCLATLAYQMLTQKLAFSLPAYKGTREDAIRLRDLLVELHKRGIKPPQMLRHDLPHNVEKVLRKGLEIDPDKRHKSPIEFAKALAYALENRAPISPSVIYAFPPKPIPIRRIALLTVVIVFLMWLLYYLFH